ncbi:hypothetical protein E2986_12641 [Frieseomelitta varia]|uniref:Uncharacterized protein n=1 Tax=Frieseomelitta varia TaxID=561572 RepID=A0A833SPS1_9HYME|nr:hypothetical protein E2986_12641 [Frieseomelitta varia]
MDFRNLSRLNILMNILSGNFLPMTSRKRKLSILSKIYLIFIWPIKLIYITAFIFGAFNVSGEKVLRDGTVNVVVLLEITVLTIYLHCRKKLLRRLIEKLNYLIEGNESIQDIIVNIVKPIEKPLTIYTIGNITAVVIWATLPFLEILRKNEFYYSDYRMPNVISKEPFSVNIFIAGIILQIIGAIHTIVRKISLDLYTIHFIFLMTAQYKYLRIKFATVFEKETEASESSCNNIVKWSENERIIKQEMRLLTRHYETVVE